MVGDATFFGNRKYLRYPPILLNYFSSQVGKQIKTSYFESERLEPGGDIRSINFQDTCVFANITEEIYLSTVQSFKNLASERKSEAVMEKAIGSITQIKTGRCASNFMLR